MKKALSFMMSSILFFTGSAMVSNSCSACEVKGMNFTDSNGNSELEDKIDEYVSRFIGKSIAGAQISVAKDGKIIFSRGYGLADMGKNIAVTRRSTFNYASVSKLFIWVSAMQLKEQGKLDLERDIRDYLPSDYPLHISSEKPVTFLNLMNHNAGFEAYWIHYDGTGCACDFNSLGEAVCGCYSGIQCFEPGEIEGYSNYGANLAAYIIERVSGVPFYEYVNENIFKICGMNCCYPEIMPIEDVLKNKAIGYMNESLGKFSVTKCYSGDWLYPSGSVIGTAEDLSLFANALMPKSGEKSPLFRSNDTLNEMLSVSYTPTGEELFSIHHGFWGTDGNYRGIGHTGCVEGMLSHFVMIPDENLSISVLVNDENGVDISYGIVWLLTGNNYGEIDDKSNFPDSKILEGEYVHARTRLVARKSPFVPYCIKSLGANRITLTVGSSVQEYRQIRPYVYENVTAKSGANFKSKIYFQVKDGKVVKATIWKNDLIPIDRLR